MKLYHGSDVKIAQIDLSKSMKGKDFGQGFYLSADYQQAMNIAKIRCLGTSSQPVVNEYDFDEKMLHSDELNVKSFDGYTLEWAEFVLANRQNKSATPIHDFDIVYGPIANDTVGRQIRLLLEKQIDMQVFIERLKYMKGITYQYFFGTDQALECLKKI